MLVFSIAFTKILNANAYTMDNSKIIITSSTIEYYDDGGYVVSTIYELNNIYILRFYINQLLNNYLFRPF